MGFFKDLFGGESDKGPEMQREENRLARNFLLEQTGKGVDTANRLFPVADERLKRGISSAANTIRQVPQAQALAQQRGNYLAQHAILGGMNAYQNAILGQPTGVSNMVPHVVNTQGMFAPFEYSPERDVTRVGGLNQQQPAPLAGIQPLLQARFGGFR